MECNKYLEEDLNILAERINKLEFEDCSVLITGATGLIGSLCVRAFLNYKNNFKKMFRFLHLHDQAKKLKAFLMNMKLAK